MPLPTISTPTYELTLPSSGKKIKYRPFLVREEKVLIMALESEDTKQITNSVIDILNSCILSKGVKLETLATAEVKDNFMGVPQQFAHTRFYTDIAYSFYIDEDYTLLKIFEGWMEYITSGANKDVEQDHRAYYRRMRYPDSYKCNTMYINKFEKNYKRTLRYRFVNVFPKSIDAVPVSYGSADILKVSVNFNYDRYIVNG